jgi:hypothetical protein
MYKTSLTYESNGMNNFSVLDEAFFYKCLMCGHNHFLTDPGSKKTFINGQKIKGVPVDVD